MSKFPQELFAQPTPDSGDDFQFLGIVPYAMNEALAYMSQQVVDDDVSGFDSIVNPKNWSIVGIDPRIPLEQDPTRFYIPPDTGVPTFQPHIGQVFVDPDDPRQIHLVCNTPLEQRVIFEVTIGPLVRGLDCQTLLGDGTRSFKSLARGVGAVPRYVQDDIYRDFDMQFFPSDPRQPSSTWRFDSTSDIGIQPADESLRKRLLRRILSDVGGFKHLGRRYGVGLGVKTLARSGELQRLSNRVAAQAREEPDVATAVAEARVVLAADGSALVSLTVVVARIDGREARLEFAIPSDGKIAA